MSRPRIALAAILLLYAVQACIGITWGLPTKRIDPFLFGGEPPWPGERIARLARAGERDAATRGADVDMDPHALDASKPVDLTATDESIAAIYLRYRLYTRQPDEMITMMALAGMKPRELKLDPRLYQYGGLFIYPVGAAIGAAGLVGLVEVTSDLTRYLDRPDEFGKFYVIARAYVALWGALGVILAYAIARDLSRGFLHTPHSALRTPHWAGLLAALLYTLMPITVCMSHEAKPHLPGAVLMLAAVWLALSYAGQNSKFKIQDSKRNAGRDWLLMCVACGAAFGMVLSALPIFVLVPLAEVLRRRAGGEGPRDRGTEGWGEATADRVSFRIPHGVYPPWRAFRILVGFAIASAVYLTSNPYVVINAFVNREVLASNLRNSTAMYEVGRIGDGLLRVLELTAEGATLPVLVVGALGIGFLLWKSRRAAILLVVPAGLIFVQFILLGAGKPAEYGRFGVFMDCTLAIAAACLLSWLATARRWVAAALAAIVIITAAVRGGVYLRNFHRDTGPESTREQLAARINPQSAIPNPQSVFCLLADPAPYNCPPMNFARVKLFRYSSLEAYLADPRGPLIRPVDARPSVFPEFIGVTHLGGWPYSPISWANKPMDLVQPPAQ